DTLARGDAGPGPKDSSTARLDALVDRSTADFVAWLNGRDGRAVAEALVARADREREAELAVLWRRLPDLEPEARHAIEGMTRHLANRLLREPLERLGRDTEGRDERAIRDMHERRVQWATSLRRTGQRVAMVSRVDDQDRRLPDLPTGWRVGPAIPRRTRVLLAQRPDFDVQPLPGNVDPRLRRLDAGET